MRRRWVYVVLGVCMVLACCIAGILARARGWWPTALVEEAAQASGVVGFRLLPEDEGRFWGRDDKVFLSMLLTEAHRFELEVQVGTQTLQASVVPCVAELAGKAGFQQCFEIDLAQFREIYGQHDIRTVGTKLRLTPLDGPVRLSPSDIYLHLSRQKWVLELSSLNREVELAQTSTGLFIVATGCQGNNSKAAACRVLAVDTQGKVRWEREALGEAKVAPIVAKHNGREVVVVAAGGRIYILEAQTGKLLEGGGVLCDASEFGVGAFFGRMAVLNASSAGPLSIVTRLPLLTGSMGARDTRYAVVRFDIGKGCTSTGVIEGRIDETHPMVVALGEQGEAQVYMLDEVGPRTWLRALRMKPEGFEERGTHAIEKKSTLMDIVATHHALWVRVGPQLTGFRLNLSPFFLLGNSAASAPLLTREGRLWLGIGEGAQAGGVLELNADGRGRGEPENNLAWRGKGGLLVGDGHILLQTGGFIVGIEEEHTPKRYQWPLAETEHALGLWPLSATRGLLVSSSYNRLEAYVVDTPTLDVSAQWPRAGHDLCNSANLLTQQRACWEGLLPEGPRREGLTKEKEGAEKAREAAQEERREAILEEKKEGEALLGPVEPVVGTHEGELAHEAEAEGLHGGVEEEAH